MQRLQPLLVASRSMDPTADPPAAALEMQGAKCTNCGAMLPFDEVEAHTAQCEENAPALALHTAGGGESGKEPGEEGRLVHSGGGLSAAEVEARAQAAFEHAEMLREALVVAVDGAQLVLQSPAWGLGDAVAGLLAVTRFTLSFTPSAMAVEALGAAARWLPSVLPQKLSLNCVERVMQSRPWRGATTLQVVTKEKRVFEFAFGAAGDEVCAQVEAAIAAHAFRGPSLVLAFAPHMVRRWEYDVFAEFARMGVTTSAGSSSSTGTHPTLELPMPELPSPTAHLWRLSQANSLFRICATYPPVLGFPASVDDELVTQAARFRSKDRLPALSWLHPRTGAAIVRCAQPLTGLAGRRSPADEQLLNAIKAANPASGTLHILDARPRANALGNSVKGAGYERVANYDSVDLAYMDIGNIHVVRSSMGKLRDLVAEPSSSDPAAQSKWLSTLESTRWLELQRTLLAAVLAVVEFVDRAAESVVVHCSDGWDRTAQMCALAELILDPYYRTLDGFAVLIEKEWCSFGYRFARRAGQLCPDYEDDQRAPIFVQFLDAVWQIMSQAPSAFEFNESLLIAIIDARYSGRYGTFLFDCPRERLDHRVDEVTSSLWAVLFDSARRSRWLNPNYSPDPGVLPVIASLTRLHLWEAYFMRWHPHMRYVASAALSDLDDASPPPDPLG
ncbi:myotubularin [Thecamonas trahens ATCC 50062]|uniref:Myotubularin n=1 Tax=Thecamonas trahens ATCC 50062 TaxID=461836 RepID=A0A0L0D9Q3_THETB|nr:myotubularin [Thecamonas trahens ATCC 50062]KNC49072.1 myotubularin [Thecamonas trahens ATCC 50062]|eukprot:XP_013758103.1 myotubularin [Thecamonas trahens ATCC 50062]